MTFITALLLFISSLVCLKTAAFSPLLSHSRVVVSHHCTRLLLASTNEKKFDDDLFDDLFNDSMGNNDPKLGIDIGKMLEPLTPEEAAQLKAEASELIAERVAKGIDDIDALRTQLKKELEVQSRERLAKSERAAEQASEKLLNKIDRMTNEFMSKSEGMRKSTKQAAAADRAMEGKGIELGSWGTLGGASVGMGGLLGSVGASASEKTSKRTSAGTGEEDEQPTAVAAKENRIIIIADPSQVRLCETLHVTPVAIVLILLPFYTVMTGSNRQVVDSSL